MSNYQPTVYLSTNELQSELRNLKLKIINGEYKFEINNSSVKDLSSELDFIKSTFPNDIISGSIVMKLYGLLRRDIRDIDILIDDKNRYTSYSQGGYNDGEETVLNRLGFKTFPYKGSFFSKTKQYKVDFFENKTAPYDIVNINGSDFKIHNPLDIMNYKMQLGKIDKHNNDLALVFKKLNLIDYASKFGK